MVTLVCPNCSQTATLADGVRPGRCPHCGAALSLPGEPAGQQTPDRQQAPPPMDQFVDETLLVADLREAFGFSTDLLHTDPVAADEHSSVTYSRILDADSSLAPGTQLGDYQIMSELGRGGMGIVYRARQVSLGREVALKVLPASGRRGREATRRFLSEAQAAGRLHHTNIVPVYAQGEQGGHFFYAMELIRGVGLDTVIRSRPDLLSSTHARSGRSAGRAADARGQPESPAHDDSPADEDSAWSEPATDVHWTRADYRHLAAIMAEVADALDCAHRNGVVHRDVKPHNLLLDEDSHLHLTDFGLARLTDTPHLTVTGEVMGTPAYLSPEQIRADVGGIDHRTDIYSLGVTLYETLTRRKPFDGETREQILSGITGTDPLPPRRLNPQVPVDLETICLRAMARSPADRHPTAALLAEDLRRFAEQRPILSRRITRLEKAVKWVRRHKALSAAIAATSTAVMLVGVLAWTYSAARQRQALQLATQAYEQLAYFDYRRPDLVQADLDRASALGARGPELVLARALASMGANRPEDALAPLEDLLADDPSEQRAWYLLAWARNRTSGLSAAMDTWNQAETLYPPASADAWFFRGLAIHFHDPREAVESYRMASITRAGEHAFYPQAVLHLARARNQELYATRRLDAFTEIETSLRQLIDYGHYEDYPYYLLSIAHRLAAEVYRGSQGTRDDEPMREHYAQALHWARAGQELYPDADRPVVAEAECLESMGLYEDAIDARSRALAVAGSEIQRCEQYHYRWRLYYWTGEFEAALADIERHAGCLPDSPFYAHFYPALVRAAMGDTGAALQHARALAEDHPASAQAVLWSATCLRLLGRGEEAQNLLDRRAADVDFTLGLEPPQTAGWVRALYECCQAGDPDDSLPALEELADTCRTPWKLWGEAHFHIAALRLAGGDRDGAEQDFETAYRSFDSEMRYTYHARLVLVQMRKDLAWPGPGEVSWGDVPAADVAERPGTGLPRASW